MRAYIARTRAHDARNITAVGGVVPISTNRAPYLVRRARSRAFQRADARVIYAFICSCASRRA
jgi:hypothetical protein